MKRRQFGALLTYGILRFILGQAAHADPAVRHWRQRLLRMCQDLRTFTLTDEQWRVCVEELMGQVELSALLQSIDFSKVSTSFRGQVADVGVSTRDVPLPRVVGLPPIYLQRIFAVRGGRAIIPHGHRNMVSMHVVLQGEFHLRQYDRVAEEAEYLVVRPTVDEVVGPGSGAAISEKRNNVHWLVARTPIAYTLDFIVPGISPQRGAVGIDNLDMGQATSAGNGLLRAKRVSVAEGLRLYGKS